MGCHSNNHLDPLSPDPASISIQPPPPTICSSSSPSPFSPLPPSFCSCCLSTLRASTVLDPGSPWAFTLTSPSERKTEWSQWWILLSVVTCSVLVLVLGLVYMFLTTPVMEH